MLVLSVGVFVSCRNPVFLIPSRAEAHCAALTDLSVFVFNVRGRIRLQARDLGLAKF